VACRSGQVFPLDEGITGQVVARRRPVVLDSYLGVPGGHLPPDDPAARGAVVALMINGLGGTPISELYILYGRAADQLAGRGINVRRSYVGEYCTSLDMAGASVTLIKLDDQLNRLLSAPAEVAVRIF
jgi:phosphoenolpyruvate---glycerone phosphotransferase subunit DhaK